MPFAKPSPAELRARLLTELALAIPGADGAGRRMVEEALARMVAVVAIEEFGYLDWVARQVNVLVCDDDTVLTWHAPLWGLTRKPATTAAGPVILTGAAGAVVPAATELRRSDDTRYLTVAAVAIGEGGGGEAAIEAVAAGADGNAAAGAVLSFLSPIPGIQSSAVVAAGELAGGAELEPVADLRARVVARIQQPPHGGAAFDYVAWALEVPGVTRAWVYPGWTGLGTVGVTVMLDGSDDPIPTLEDIAVVTAHLEPLRPVTAELVVFAPVAEAIDFQIALNPNTSAVQTAVAAELSDLITREAEPGGTLFLSRIRAAISAGAGEHHHALVSPSADVVAEPGHIAQLGTIAWSGL
ncbi:MAG: baseplate J protein [Candidatus Hydrogenedens sp.]|nr:baseplate J protein [Candidatus Hydrogenedens sp.]